ncbi:hypothetical protein [Herbidospora daliensis]|uniref:hypothetical protein n=1 Tax=Herbidospora daliensis TaxID=295585 RepID=UPI0018DEB7A0|nr:hypothetical protein [Herbidospora daliensis]
MSVSGVFGALDAFADGQKHGMPVLVGWKNDQLPVEIIKQESSRPQPRGRKLSTGHGLLGLRERVLVIGGTFEAAALPTGGFRVRALLPNAHTRQQGQPPASHP